GKGVPVKTRYPLPRPSNCLGDRKQKVSSLPPCSLLGHVTGPGRLQDHSSSTALLAHAQWVPGCEAASCHSRVPTLKMPASWNTRRPVKWAVGHTV
ncbi:unnamed protein product, partial [Staurois parvus]